MIPISRSFSSSLGKKIVMGLTGLGLSLFVTGHLLGNLSLFLTDQGPFNVYAHFLTGLGELLYMIEAGLIVVFLVHVFYGSWVTISNWIARPIGCYEKTTPAKGASRKTLASSTMIYTGLAIFTFIFLHVLFFKYGPGMAEGYVFNNDGKEIRDLYKLVYEAFGNGWYVLWYCVTLIFLGYHLSHGFWSAFQSLGINHPVYTPFLQKFAIVFAIFIGGGFLSIPLYIFISTGGLQ